MNVTVNATVVLSDVAIHVLSSTMVHGWYVECFLPGMRLSITPECGGILLYFIAILVFANPVVSCNVLL